MLKFQEFLNEIVKINLRTGSFLKGKLLQIDSDFLKLETLSQIRFVAISDIVDIRIEKGSEENEQK